MSDYTDITKIIQPFFNQNGKLIGKLEDGVLRKVVRGSIHMLRKPRGWAWDKNVIDESRQLGVKTVEIIDSETKIKYLAELIDFLQYGILINRGFGEQIALPMNYWSIENPHDAQIKMF